MSSETDTTATDASFLTLSQFDRDSFSTVHLQLVRPQPSATSSGYFFETVLPIEATGIHIDSPDAIISSRVVTRVNKNQLTSEPDFQSTALGHPVTAGETAGTLVGYDEASLVIARDEGREVTSVKRPERLTAVFPQPTERRPEGTYLRCGLTFLLPEPPQMWTVNIRYQVSSRLLGWQPEYHASVQADNSAQFTALFKVRNELSVSFAGAKVIFSTHALGEAPSSSPLPSSGSADYLSSSLFSSSAKKSKLPMLSKRPSRSPTRLATYQPETEYFYQNGAPFSIAAEQTQSLVYHHHRFDFEPSECWYVFDACSEYPKPGIIRTDDHLTKNSIANSTLPYMIDVANTEDNGFGLDLPTASAEIYTNSRLLPSLYTQPPMSQFFDTDTLSASFRGERIRIPVHTPSDFFTCRKERSSYRHAGNTLTETFVYTVENQRGVVPIDVLIVDCAFRHHEWYVLRQSTACDRVGAQFFQIPVRQVPYGARVEVSITIEYAFNLAPPAHDPAHPADDSTDDQSAHPASSSVPHHHHHKRPKAPPSSTGGFLGSLFSK